MIGKSITWPGLRLCGAVLCASCAGLAFADIPLNIANPGFEAVEKGMAKGWHYGKNFKAARDGHNGSGGLVWSYTEGVDNVDSIRRCAWQEVGPLKKGKCYVLSMNVQPRKVTTVRSSPRMGISIRLECFDAKGKRILQTRTHPLPSGTRDWTKVETLTRPMPGGIASAKLEIFASDCTGGSAAIDQIYLAEQERLPVEAVYSAAYRNEATDGRYKFAAPLNYEPDSPFADYEADFIYASAAGCEKRVKAELTQYGAWAYLDVGDFAFGTNAVSCELRRDGKVLGRGALPFARLREPAKRRVTLDRYNRVIIDGKPTFLMGMSFESLPVTEENLRLYTEAEFNLFSGEYKSRKDLDLVHKFGLHAVIRAHRGYTDPDHGLKAVRDLVEMVKDHPATAIYYINDEQPIVNAPWVKARKELVWSLDPDHPTWSTQDKPEDARDHMAGLDILECDPYPIGAGVLGGSVGDTLDVMRKIRRHLERSFDLRPSMHAPQYFSWAWLRSRKPLLQNRSPSPHEMANMSWQMIALGATGLNGYSFNQMFHRNRDKARPYEKFEFYWPAVKAIVHDIRRYEDVILSTEPGPKILEGNADPFVARTWRKGGDVYLLAVCGENKISKVSIKLSEKPGRVLDWDFCEKPVVKGDTVTFSFHPCGFGMVRLGKKSRRGKVR